MKDKTPNSNASIARKGNKKDGVMAILQAVRDALEP
jgi:hypothetical protein